MARSFRQQQLLSKTNIFDVLTDVPGSFSFGQATLFSYKKLLANGVPAPEKNLRFKVNPDLSFPPSDVFDLKFEGDGAETKALMTLNLMGLHGAGSPLPSYFTEYVAQHQDEPCPLLDFFDLFNHELVDLFYGSWLKYRYHIQYEDGAADRLSCRFFSFLGLGHKNLRDTEDLNLLRLLPYIGLIAFSGEATGSLESILRHYFRHCDLEILPCIVRQVAIPDDQKSRLGQNNSVLGESNDALGGECLLGEIVRDQHGKFRIVIKNLDWQLFNKFLPIGDTFPQVASLVRFVMRSQIGFDIELRLKPEEVPLLYIGENSENRLAWSSWLGDGGDGIVQLEPVQN